MHFSINITFSLGKLEIFTYKADYSDEIAECVHVTKLPETSTGQDSTCAVLTTTAF